MKINFSPIIERGCGIIWNVLNYKKENYNIKFRNLLAKLTLFKKKCSPLGEFLTFYVSEETVDALNTNMRKEEI
jgi:hypothetical protein